MNLQHSSIEIETDSAPGSNELIRAVMYTAKKDKIGGVWVHFRETPMFAIGYCSSISTAMENFSPTIPESEFHKHTWKITKENLTIRIFCDGTQVVVRVVDVDYKGSSDCVNRWRSDVSFVEFSADLNYPDKATDRYRIVNKGKRSFYGKI